jgi:DtxR family Mn-dependent transcriptional regulator
MLTALDPGVALAVGLGLVALVALAVWPERGLLARWRRWREASERVALEDALKHLYDFEYRKLTGTRQSIAGALAISDDDAARLIQHLEGMKLLAMRGDRCELTDDGRAYALRVIRIHRLWERYLADETGIGEMEWHPRAEAKEHRMSAQEADALADQLGDPRYDPHGDPIPTSGGDVPERWGFPLTSLHAGDVAQVVHVEDEPAVVYAQLVAQGLQPGVRLRVVSVEPDRIRYEAEGYENALAPVVAANVTVVPMTQEVPGEEPQETLASVHPGERAEVLGISRRCRGQQRRRLMDLGVVPGTVITSEITGPTGDPTAFTIRGATIALRKAQSSMIYVRKEGDSGTA